MYSFVFQFFQRLQKDHQPFLGIQPSCVQDERRFQGFQLREPLEAFFPRDRMQVVVCSIDGIVDDAYISLEPIHLPQFILECS